MATESAGTPPPDYKALIEAALGITIISYATGTGPGATPTFTIESPSITAAQAVTLKAWRLANANTLYLQWEEV